MSYDYAACKKYPGVSVFGLGALINIKFISSILHRQSSGASLWGGIWASKLPAAIGIAYMGAEIKKKVIPAPGE
ncbi:hypothetical protein TNCV_3346551 [Trichonephila clavipes]|nr:hypothetical protein TNCV_3346551 [Trichonephila clavipes]